MEYSIIVNPLAGSGRAKKICLPVDGNGKSSGAESPCGSFQE